MERYWSKLLTTALFFVFLSTGSGKTEVFLCAVLLVSLLLFLLVFYRDLIAASFDEAFAHTRGIDVKRLNMALILFTSVAVVLAFKVVGIFLISALIILPPVTALLVAKTFKQVLIWAAVVAVLSVWSGVYLSFVFNIPSGATIILVNLLFLLMGFVYSKLVSLQDKKGEKDVD